MSHSEGLSYMLYTGPCPPTRGFMAPMYETCGPASVNPGMLDCLNAAYSVPSSYQQGMGTGMPNLLSTYCPPHSMLIINSSLSRLAVENMILFLEATQYGAPENQLSLREVNFTRQVRHCHTKNIQASKGSDL